MTRIWNTAGDHIGDMWAAINYAARQSEQLGTTEYISDENNQRQNLEEIMSCLELPVTCRVATSPASPTDNIRGKSWEAKYYPTKTKWNGPSSKIICFQFDGRSYASKKNPPDSDIALIEKFAAQQNYTLLKVGKPLSIQQSINIMADSCLFVGVCSGMSHVAHSVGLPVYLLEYKLKIHFFHRGNNYIACQGAIDFIRRLQVNHPSLFSAFSTCCGAAEVVDSPSSSEMHRTGNIIIPRNMKLRKEP